MRIGIAENKSRQIMALAFVLLLALPGNSQTSISECLDEAQANRQRCVEVVNEV
jgi:hypothetical protein